MANKKKMQRAIGFSEVIKGNRKIPNCIIGSGSSGSAMVRLDPYTKEVFGVYGQVTRPRSGKIVSVIREPLTNGPDDYGMFEIMWLDLPDGSKNVLQVMPGDKIAWYI